MRLTKTTKLVLGSNKSVLNRAIQCRNFATPAAPATENRHSYLKNNEQKFEPIKNTVGYVMSKNARAQPYSNALRSTHQDIQLSQATLKKHIEALACGYLELGLRIGDRVGIIQGATAEQYIVQIACAKIGAIAVQFQGINNAKDLARYLDLFRPRFLVLPTKVGKTDYLKIVQEAFPEMNSVNPRLQTTIPFKSNRFTFLKYVFFTDADEAPLPGTSLLQEALLYGPFGYYDGPLRRVAFKLNSDTPAAIVLEGGIDKGKNVVLTQGNILNAASAIANTLGLQQGDVVFVPSYQQSTFGIVANYTAFVSGATVVFPSRDFNASEVLRQLNAEKCTALFIRRTEVDALLAQQSDNKYDTVKYIVTDQVTQDDISNLQKKFTNAKVVVIGGLEEANALLSIDGKLLPGIEAKVTRDGDDRIVHKDTFGDLRIRGHTVSTKVWNDIGLMNADVDEEGWVRTGRLGKIDANNQLSMQ